MKVYHIDKAKDYRRIMLDVLEVVPRRFRYKIMDDMKYTLVEGDFMAEYNQHLHRDLLQFFYRLRNSRSFRHATPHQNALLQSILDRLEEAHRYDTGQVFRFETAEEKQASRKEWQARAKESREIRQRRSEWIQKHPLLSGLLDMLNNPFMLPVSIASLLIVLAVANFCSWH